MSAARVHLYFEDKTGGGLGAVLQRAVNARRRQQELEHVQFQLRHANGNADLVHLIDAFPKLLHSSPDPPDHVVYVIDARNVTDVHRLRVAGLDSSMKDLDSLVSAVPAAMARVAQDACGDRWHRFAPRFQAHVLVWERESLILPVADALGLGPTETDVEGERAACEWVKRRYREHRPIGYSKGSEGKKLLEKIANDRELRERTIAVNPSLQRMVAALTGLAPGAWTPRRSQ